MEVQHTFKNIIIQIRGSPQIPYPELFLRSGTLITTIIHDESIWRLLGFLSIFLLILAMNCDQAIGCLISIRKINAIA